jgi:hypothetical protein
MAGWEGVGSAGRDTSDAKKEAQDREKLAASGGFAGNLKDNPEP